MSLVEVLKGMDPPTVVRIPDEQEWRICEKVFGDTLPLRQRILITNAYGLGKTKFTIPTAAISTVGLSAASLGLSGAFANPMPGIIGSAIAYAQSIVSFGYMINVGIDAEKTMAGNDEALLVHEMTHVWQGYNGTFSMGYIISSFANQCKGIISSRSFGGRNKAYGTLGFVPTGPWEDMNAEEQANVVEYWFDQDKMSKTSPRWNYMKYYIRKGTDSGEIAELEGLWEVRTNGKIYHYWIQEGGYCKWYSRKQVTPTHYAPFDGKGDWEIKGDRVEIEWESGDKEKWFLPLSNTAQKGEWTTPKGVVLPILAKRG